MVRSAEAVKLENRCGRRTEDGIVLVKRINVPNNLQLFFCPVLPAILRSVAFFKGSLSPPACSSADSSIMISYLARLLDIMINNDTIPRD
jgi:hypothetical protein